MIEKYMRDEAFIEVNLGDVQDQEKYEYLLSVFVKFDAFHEEIEAVENFLELKQDLIDQLEDEAVYVGMRVVDGWSEIYFYTSQSKNVQKIVASVFSESGYKYESSISKDPKWKFFYKTLYPTDLETYLIYSKKIVLQMMAEGDSLVEVREVEHYVSFDTASQKERFIKEVQEVGFHYKDDVDSAELPHAVAVVKEHALDQDSLRKVISELLGYIEKNHGHYELWSAPLVNAT